MCILALFIKVSVSKNSRNMRWAAGGDNRRREAAAFSQQKKLMKFTVVTLIQFVRKLCAQEPISIFHLGMSPSRNEAKHFALKNTLLFICAVIWRKIGICKIWHDKSRQNIGNQNPPNHHNPCISELKQKKTFYRELQQSQ